MGVKHLAITAGRGLATEHQLGCTISYRMLQDASCTVWKLPPTFRGFLRVLFESSTLVLYPHFSHPPPGSSLSVVYTPYQGNFSRQQRPLQKTITNPSAELWSPVPRHASTKPRKVREHCGRGGESQEFAVRFCLTIMSGPTP